MKVGSVLEYLVKVNNILKMYENESLDFMLDDIFNKVSKDKISEVSNPEMKATHIIDKIYSELLDKDQVFLLISELKRAELLKIAKHEHLQVPKSYSKDMVIELISNHFGFVNLNNHIENRSTYNDKNTSIIEKEINKIQK